MTFFGGDREVPGRPVNHTSISLRVKDSGRVSESSWQSKASVPLGGGLVCCIYQSEAGLMLNGASLASELTFYGLTFWNPDDKWHYNCKAAW